MRITLRDIHKHYGRLRANDGISMEIAEGSIHGILGENGAGKSTLMKVLAGYVHRTRGSILLDGRVVEYNGPGEATHLGIGMLYQDPLDFPSLSVLENYMMGRSKGFSGHKTFYRRQLEDAADHFGFNLDPGVPVRRLTVGERQQLEIVRLLALGVQVLILDEPTTGISSLQREALFTALRRLADQHKTILLVSHKLEDVESLCDRVSVLRQGKVAGETDQPFNTPQLLDWMFGSTPGSPPRAHAIPGAVTLAMEEVSAQGGRAGLACCSVTIQQGEVVGLAGLEGSGQDVFLRLASGLMKPHTGSIRLRNKVMTGRDYHAFNEDGVTFIPAARLEEGLIPTLTITEHFALQAEQGILVPWTKSRKMARERISRFRILGGPSSVVESLSGGNQQRLLLALMPPDPALLVLEHPTRGLDVESAQWVWQELIAYTEKGAAIVFSSSELDEILHVASRILVFYNGMLIKDTQTHDTTLAEIGQTIAGKG
jgi:simple sugar transport system ATP-binding protein